MLTRERLEELNAQPGVTVMENKYTHEFEPRPTTDVYDVVKRLATHTLAYKDTKKARYFALQDDEFCEFAKDYQATFQKFTTYEFVKDERAIQAVMALMQLRRQVERGELSSDVAGSKACEVALQVSLAKGAEAEGSSPSGAEAEGSSTSGAEAEGSGSAEPETPGPSGA
jgi:hypothetical protein